MPCPSLPWLRLLVVLLVAAGCGASQQQQQQRAAAGPDRAEFDREVLETFIRRAVTAATEPLLGSLTDRLQRLDSRLDGLATRLDSQDHKLSGLITRMEKVYTITTNGILPRDCSDLAVGSQSGIYLLQPGLDSTLPPVSAFCDLDTNGGGWTVVQRRADIQPRRNFSRTWAAYRGGFGDLDAEFWWGLHHLWAMTSARDRQYELRIDLQDFEDEKRYALYQGFRISSEHDGYRLMAGNYTGTAGDSLRYSVGQMFSTKDKDQDGSPPNCGEYQQGGWWHKYCTNANLNGAYSTGVTPGLDGVYWYHWKGLYYSLKVVEMKIRPV